MIIGPGETAQWLHRDAENWPSRCVVPTASRSRSAACSRSPTSPPRSARRAWCPAATGGTTTGAGPTPDEICQAVMPAGAGMIYTGRVLHGGGANATADQFRYGLHLSYVLGWLTPEEAGAARRDWADVAAPVRRAPNACSAGGAATATTATPPACGPSTTTTSPSGSAFPPPDRSDKRWVSATSRRGSASR